MRTCSKCGAEKPLDLDHFYVSKQNKQGFHTICRSCMDALTREWNRKNPEKRSLMNSNYRKNHKEELWAASIRRNYNTTSEWYYRKLAEQNGLCAVCLRPPVLGERLRIDHNHSCCPQAKGTCGNCNRGLVHHTCNSALGLLDDSPTVCRLAALYLEKHKRD